MPDSPTCSDLKAREEVLPDDFPDRLRLRIHRAISWICRAEDCGDGQDMPGKSKARQRRRRKDSGDDKDARFIFLWIAFNAAYAKLPSKNQKTAPKERILFKKYFKKLVVQDKAKRIDDALWNQFSGPIRELMENQYVFGPFWHYHNGIDGFDNWKGMFNGENRHFKKVFFHEPDTIEALSRIFDRLYVLRNQLLHGAATWGSSVNREQVRDGTAILAFLVPIFVELMMDNARDIWGQPLYRVVKEDTEA